MKNSYFIFLLLSFTTFAQIQSLDNSFNIQDNGVYQQNIGTLSVPHPNGGMLSLRLNPLITLKTVVKLGVDGNIEESFPETEAFSISKILIKNDGKFAIIHVDGDNYSVTKFNANGTIDATFTTPTFLNFSLNNNSSNTRITDGIYQDDGKIILTGEFRKVNNIDCYNIVRLNNNGSFDTSFSNANLFVTDYYDVTNTITRQPDGKYLVGGEFKGIGNSNVRIARLNADGTRDITFNVYSTFNFDSTDFMSNGFDSEVDHIVLQSDGKILVAGTYFRTNGAISTRGITRLNTNGTRDLSFNYTTIIQDGINPNKICLQPDGKIVFYLNNAVQRISSLGVIDPSFSYLGYPDNFNTVGSSGEYTDVENIYMQGNKIIVNSHYLEPSGKSRYGMFRLNNDASLDVTFNPQSGTNMISASSTSSSGSTTSISRVLNNSKILLLGKFSAYNDSPANSICRITPDGLLDPSFTIDPQVKLNFNPNFTILTKNYPIIREQTDGKIIISSKSWAFLSVDNVPVKIIRLNQDGSLDTTFNFNETIAEFNDFDLQSDNKIIGVGQGQMFQQGNQFKAIRLNIDGSLDSSFSSPLYNKAIQKVILQNDEKIYLIYKTSDALTTAQRLNSNGTLDPSFSTNLLINNIKIQEDQKLIISYKFNQRVYLGRINNNGTVDTSFTTNFGPAESSNNIGYEDIFVNSQGQIIIRPYVFYNNHFNFVPISNSFYVLNQNGVLQSTFGSLDILEDGLQQQDCDKIIITGTFDKIDNINKSNIIRYNISGNTTPNPPTGLTNQSFEQGQTLTNLVLTGQNIQWYSFQNSCSSDQDSSSNTIQSTPETLPSSTVLTNGFTYFASQTVNGIESFYRLPITVNSTLSVTENKLQSVKLYPNPTQDFLTISGNDNFENIAIYDLLGKNIANQKANSNNLTIDVTSFKTGIYILKINQEKNTRFLKFVKK